jgi:hypothetical protein
VLKLERVFVIQAEDVLDVVELRVIVRVPRGLFDIIELAESVGVAVFVFEPTERVKVAEALEIGRAHV